MSDWTLIKPKQEKKCKQCFGFGNHFTFNACPKCGVKICHHCAGHGITSSGKKCPYCQGTGYASILYVNRQVSKQRARKLLKQGKQVSYSLIKNIYRYHKPLTSFKSQPQ